MMDFDCMQTCKLLAAILARCSAKEFQNNMFDSWRMGALHRLLMAIHWSKKLRASPALGIAQGAAGWPTTDDCAELSVGITHNMTARGAFREVAKAEREIWVTYFTSQLMDVMNLEAISNADEVRAAFLKCITDTNGFPVAC